MRVAIDNARLHAPDCRVVYLRNRTSSVGYEDECDMSYVFESAMLLLAENDRLYGPSDCMFEKCSIARWRMLGDWMSGHGVERVCFSDSDVLWFGNPFKTPHCEVGKIMVSGNGQGWFHAGNSVVTLEFVEDVWKRMVDILDGEELANGCINDMALIKHVIDNGRHPYSEQNRIIDGVAFDHHMGFIDGWENDGAYKVLNWINGKPHCRRTDTGENVRLINLHCWGDAEPHMAEYAAMGGL